MTKVLGPCGKFPRCYDCFWILCKLGYETCLTCTGKRRENREERERTKSAAREGVSPAPALLLSSAQLPRALFPSAHSPAHRKDERDLWGGERHSHEIFMMFHNQSAKRHETTVRKVWVIPVHIPKMLRTVIPCP